ncbi:PDZ domain-containing protein [Paludifilum halophilum]|uniref:PDZ domain-containing protein n=1 Tax=Paludifilum halophilum TaxID=1642702 RepID=A0A235B726_9BACL|nr:PDZ domain-containing protein [Paludifilum halophilum]OYD08113.1 hypothetical protein CHM34_08365 [Paludifilum halophilum]
METVLTFFNLPTESWKVMWTHPLWLAAVLLAAWQYAWKSLREQKRFGRRLDPPTLLFLRSLTTGLGAGLLLSAVTVPVTLTLNPSDLLWVWGVLIPLACFRLRFACLAYAVGLASLASLSLNTGQNDFLAGWVELHGLKQFAAEDWLLIVGLVHLAEWVLVRLDGEKGSTPVLEQDIHRRVVGGYRMQKVWPIPLVAATSAGWLPLPVVSGFACDNLSRHPLQQKRRLSSFLLLYAVTLLILVELSEIGQGMLWAAAFFSVLGHEFLYRMNRIREKRRIPLYAADSEGIKVLAVLPDTPAEKMGIQPGETVLRVNGVKTKRLNDLETALHQSPAFCKLELFDVNGETKLAQRPLYEGDPPHLGLVEAPALHRVETQEPKTATRRWTS